VEHVAGIVHSQWSGFKTYTLIAVLQYIVLYKKSLQRMVFVRKLKSITVLFYQSVIVSVLFSAFVNWGGDIACCWKAWQDC